MPSDISINMTSTGALGALTASKNILQNNGTPVALNINRIAIIDANGRLGSSCITTDELNHLDNITENIQSAIVESRLGIADLDLDKAPKANPTFTGTVSGITAAMVGLGNVTNESKTTMFTDSTFVGAATFPKVKLTPEGGIAVKMTNKTGGVSVKGEVVTAGFSVDNSVIKTVVDVPNPIGVFYESGVADASEAWVVASGIADVYFVGNTTRGHLARGFLTADGGSYVTGQALSEALPTTPFASDKHFYEIGHVLESRTGAGLAKTILHFN